MTCTASTCQTCGARLVHQSSKNPHESSSALGQHVHDAYAKTFFFADIDGAIYKRSTGILRIVEHKHPGQEIRPSQKTLLPLLSVAVQGLVDAQLVHPESGVFAMWASEPFESAAVTRVRPGAPVSTWATPKTASVLPHGTLRAFLTGELLTCDLEETG